MMRAVVLVMSMAVLAIGALPATPVQAASIPATAGAAVTAAAPDASIGVGTFSCITHTVITLAPAHREAVASAWVSGCVGAAVCAEQVDMQERSPTNPNNWFTIKHASGHGCTPAGGADAVAVRCLITPRINHYYRAHGIVAVVWTNGSRSTGSWYSPGAYADMAC
jgi:hypothetical protein